MISKKKILVKTAALLFLGMVAICSLNSLLPRASNHDDGYIKKNRKDDTTLATTLNSLASGSSGLRFTGDRIRTYSSSDTESSDPPPPVQVPPFEKVFGEKSQALFPVGSPHHNP